jgi:hypothetical protein
MISRVGKMIKKLSDPKRSTSFKGKSRIVSIVECQGAALLGIRHPR